MAEKINTYNEKDLFIFIQNLRLKTAKDLNDRNVWLNGTKDDVHIKALMVNPYAINDDFIKDKVKRNIQKRVDLLKTGKISVKGNYQIAIGEPIIQLESAFGLEPKGILKANEFFIEYWRRLEVNKVGAFRSPMSCKENAKVIVIEYKGKPNSKQKISFVGKGIIFDSGGYNLKTPGKYMNDMKFDMSGAAIALLLVDTLSKLNVKKNISCVIPVTDNMIDAAGQLPETILTSMSGKTVEVVNTDAEGRLILADAITYAAKKLNSSLIIDLATLTGTVIYALGKYTGAWSSKDQNWTILEKAAKNQNELIWRMPLNDIFLNSLYKNTHADILSCSDTDKPDSNIAAAWLNLFANGKDYIHLDIAGSADEKSFGKAPMFKTLINFVNLLN